MPLAVRNRIPESKAGSEGSGHCRGYCLSVPPVRPGKGFAFRAGSKGSYVISLPLERQAPYGCQCKFCGAAATTTLGPKGPVKLKNPPADRPVKPGNLLHNPFAQPAADRRPQPAAQPPPQPSAAKPLSNLRTLGAIAPSNFRTFYIIVILLLTGKIREERIFHHIFLFGRRKEKR